MKMAECKFDWRIEIEQIDKLRRQSIKELKSPTFFWDTNKNHRCYLSLTTNSDYISLQLCLEDSDVLGEISVAYRFALYNLTGDQLSEFKDKKLFDIKTKSKFGCDKFMRARVFYHGLSLDRNFEYDASDQNITVTCFTSTKVISSTNNATHQIEEISDFEKLLYDSQFSDFTLITSNKTFKVHKNILSARSSVFSAMFMLDMKEKAQNSATIADFDGQVIEELLRYIYSTKVKNIETFAHKLYSAADKYDLSGLKRICIETLSQNLTIENALDIFSMASLHNVIDLKIQISDFIAKHIKDIVDAPNFETLADPVLLREILYKVAHK